MAVSKRFLKLIIFFLTLPKRALSSGYIFKIDNYCHIPIQLMLAKYDTSPFTKDQKVHSDLHHDSDSEFRLDIQDKSDKLYDNFKEYVFLLVVS